MPQVYHNGLEATAVINGVDVNADEISENPEATTSEITNSSDFNTTYGIAGTREISTKITTSGEISFGFDSSNRVDLALINGITVPLVITKVRGGSAVTVSGNALIKGMPWSSGGRDGHQTIKCSYMFQGLPTRT